MWVTKRNTLIMSGLVSTLVFLIDHFGTVRLCGGEEFTVCINTIANLYPFFIPFIPLCLLVLMTYRLHNEVFLSWIKFAFVWVPLTMFLTLVTPEYGNQSLFPLEKGGISFWFSILLFLISLIIIIYKYSTLRSVKK